MLVGDFNAQIGEKCFDDLLFQHELRSVNDRATCYKYTDKSSCIDFILTNSPLRFHRSDCLFTGLSHCHKLVLPLFKTTFPNQNQRKLFAETLKNLMKKILIKNFVVDCPLNWLITIAHLKMYL